MKPESKFKGAGILQTALFIAGLVMCSFSHDRSIEAASFSANLCEDYVDGTQLEYETRELIADRYHLSISLVSATYCCQMTDGRYKYSVTTPTQSGYVYWTVINGIIGGDDSEGL